MTPDAATVAAVLGKVVADHEGCTWSSPNPQAALAGSSRPNRVQWTCGMVAERYEPHLAAALLASEPIAQALAAVARVEALRDQWQENYPGPTAACNRTPDEWGHDLGGALRPEGCTPDAAEAGEDRA